MTSNKNIRVFIENLTQEELIYAQKVILNSVNFLNIEEIFVLTMHKYDLINNEDSSNNLEDRMSEEDIEITKNILEI
jgi:hypothetical protein